MPRMIDPGTLVQAHSFLEIQITVAADLNPVQR